MVNMEDIIHYDPPTEEQSNYMIMQEKCTAEKIVIIAGWFERLELKGYSIKRSIEVVGRACTIYDLE